jgi:hypothetical protein
LIASADIASCKGAGMPDTDAQGMTTPKTEEDLVTGYRSAAEECRQQAGRAATQLLRDHCLKIADEWIKLAEEAERTPSMRRN